MNTQTRDPFTVRQPNLTETREVCGFDQVSLRVPNIESDLVILQGEQESLVIEADPSLAYRVNTCVQDGVLMIKITGSWSDFIKEALTTSLTRQRIQYILTVKQLTALEMDGILHLEAARLVTDHLKLRFRGPGSASLASFHARSLEVDMTGPCKVEITGNVVEQRIVVGVIGYYHAPRLESKKATVRLNGPGQATICVSDELDATIAGPGRLEYFGAPRVKQKCNPLGLLVSLGKP